MHCSDHPRVMKLVANPYNFVEEILSTSKFAEESWRGADSGDKATATKDFGTKPQELNTALFTIYIFNSYLHVRIKDIDRTDPSRHNQPEQSVMLTTKLLQKCNRMPNVKRNVPSMGYTSACVRRNLSSLHVPFARRSVYISSYQNICMNFILFSICSAHAFTSFGQICDRTLEVKYLRS